MQVAMVMTFESTCKHIPYIVTADRVVYVAIYVLGHIPVDCLGGGGGGGGGHFCPSLKPLRISKFNCTKI